MRQALWPRTGSRLIWMGSLIEPHFQCNICSSAEVVLRVCLVAIRRTYTRLELT